MGWDVSNFVLLFFLSRLSGNDIGAEGARVLAEPLGKLTALRKLGLEKMFSSNDRSERLQRLERLQRRDGKRTSLLNVDCESTITVLFPTIACLFL